jgi:hypothetical protein
VEEGNRLDKDLDAVRMEKPKENLKKKIFRYTIKDYKVQQRVLWHKKKLVVLLLITTEVIREVHKSRETDHTSRAKTIKAIENSRYFILKAADLIRRFLRNYYIY